MSYCAGTLVTQTWLAPVCISPRLQRFKALYLLLLARLGPLTHSDPVEVPSVWLHFSPALTRL
jgi:hypothetical protein